jgi:succinoglycan biosynthesis protein ExoO
MSEFMTQRGAPRVSVVVPAHNVEPWIGKAIASVLTQTEPSFELLVVDDCSTDATREVIRSIHDARLRLIESERNGGTSAARNRAISQARGEWIALLDADDWWEPQRLERLLEAASQAKTTMVVDDCYLIEDGAMRPWSRLFRVRGLQIDAPRLIGAAEFMRLDLGLAKPMIRRDYLIRHCITFDEQERRAEDFPFYVNCLLAGASLLGVPDAFYFYRARRGAATSDRVGVNESMTTIADRLARDERVRNDPELRLALARLGHRARSEIRYYELVRFLKAGRIVPAAGVAIRSPGVLWTAARHTPTVLRARRSRVR